MAQVLWNLDIDVYNPQVIPLPVARKIARYLDIKDVLLFSRTLRNCYKAANDPELWIRKLRAMNAWDKAPVATKEQLLKKKFAELSNPLTCLDAVYRVPKIAKFQVLKIRDCLEPFYADLRNNVPYERLKIFKLYETPQEQAKILKFLLQYNAIDSDDTTRDAVRDKLTDLIEIFENALLRELEIHFDIQDYEKSRSFVNILIDLGNDQTLLDFFIQKMCFDNDSIKFVNPELFSVAEFFVQRTAPAEGSKDSEDEESEEQEEDQADSEHSAEKEDSNSSQYSLSITRFEEFSIELATAFNRLAHVVDLVFPQSVPMMYNISEELITNQLQESVLMLAAAAKERSLYAEMMPLLYNKIAREFVDRLEPCKNVGETYLTIVRELVDSSFESFALEFMNEEKLSSRLLCSLKIREWKVSLERKEQETSQNILQHVRAEAKSDFLSTFKKVFSVSSSNKVEEKPTESFSEVQAKAQILAANIKLLNEVFSPQLALSVLNDAKQTLARLSTFKDFTVSAVRTDVLSTMQEVFMNVLDELAAHHLKPGFERALKYLRDYNPREIDDLIEGTKKGSAIGPLVIFFEQINMADMIVQMLDIFYKEEMIVGRVVRHENSVLNPSLQSKKNLEGMVDKYVADGLNIGMDVLFKELDSLFLSTLKESDYNPGPLQLGHDGPSAAAKRAVAILEDNIDLLVDSAEKSIVDVFQQEVAERFFQTSVKVLKRSTVSVDGAVTLISDLNLYYQFMLDHIKSNKRMIYPLFQALKKVGSLYLISGDDAKSIGQLVSDLLKFNGIFSQEEIYEFVQRRLDWMQIRKHVEKVMYGLSINDCVIV